EDIALGDLDGDGDLDAFVISSYDDDDNNVPSTIWLNDGHGNLSDSQQRLGSADNWAVALGDVDGDDDLDAFVVNAGDFEQDASEVWLNQGGAQSGTPGVFSDSGQSLGNTPSADVALGDLDGDGDLDAFVSHFDAPDEVWLNDGTGVFTDSGQSLWDTITPDSWQVALGDVDGDGDLDALIEANGIQVWLNDGSAGFSQSAQGISTSSEEFFLGDVDGDGDLDVLLENAVWLNDGTGVFTDSGQSLGVDQYVMDIGDLDGDSDLDAIVKVD
ncbi:MAG: hypothetical protein GY832_13710, partial [Chloroflexi bacterium]|nr:hypothetical protein [Chloroflexota bacterium]